MGKCEASLSRELTQERSVTTRTEKLIKHSDDTNFIINLYGIHNGDLLRKTLPAHLVKPKPLYNNRQEHHAKIAATLRVEQTVKRARTQEKRKATREAKQADKRRRDVQETDGPGDENEQDVEAAGDDELPSRKRTRHR
jgi:hypothetical protein